ncbi:hypothetical protein MVEN_01834700 [Mycena venus]|uniref:NACHT domain-containing protein n=1 Tax=Mycena venus TaxID=2733690 RepID=A0A8H6XLG8_9AGAR|nr:hypothetical protein MVEN_01834700 [Mycena venus]
MSGHSKQPQANFPDRRRITRKRSPAPYPPPSRSTTPAPSNRRGLSSGATRILPSNPKSAPKGVDKGADSLEGDKSDTAEFMPVGPTNIHLAVSGGVGGRGGQGGVDGGDGGTGEGPKIIFPNSTVTLTNPDATELQSIKEKLANHVAAQYKFTDQSKSLCAAGTRVEIQADIFEWLSPQPGTKEHIFWITGIAGSGKSTLSATLVDNLRKKGAPVAAQFFISRNIPETINPAKIIPTIAQQLAELSPAAACIIHEKLKDGFPPSRKEQVEGLLLAPIRKLSESCDAVIILIDALDELENAADSVKEILESIAPRGCYLPENVRFLVTSRPEHWAVISGWVDISGDRTLELTMFKQHALETKSSVSEVHNFIITRMKEITPRDWDGWPTRDQLLQLSTKADGLFHYAATALQWINEQVHKRGKACRKEVFEKFAQLGIGQLQDLYRLILTSFENIDGPAQDADWRASQLQGFQHVIGTILVLYEPLTICQIIALLADIPEDNFDVKNFLQQFRSVLIPGITTLFEDATSQMHKSFRDYIMDVHAPAGFHILTGHAHFVTARSCLEVIAKPRSQSDVVVEYSVGHWYKHLRKAVEGTTTWEDEKMWTLFGQMVEETVISIWAATDLLDLFVDVAAAGWGLLKQHANEDKMQRISNILTKTKEVGAVPPWPMLVLLTFSCLLVSSSMWVLFPYHPCWSCSLFLAFWSLGSGRCSPITHDDLAHFFLPFGL